MKNWYADQTGYDKKLCVGVLTCICPKHKRYVNVIYQAVASEALTQRQSNSHTMTDEAVPMIEPT